MLNVKKLLILLQNQFFFKLHDEEGKTHTFYTSI